MDVALLDFVFDCFAVAVVGLLAYLVFYEVVSYEFATFGVECQFVDNASG